MPTFKDKINHYDKDYVFEQYVKIVRNFKNYDSISRKKMLDAIYEEYSNYENIIDICTLRELKFLKKLTANFNDLELFKDDKYEWERGNLLNKFLIARDFKNDTFYIPNEIIEFVNQAVKKVNWKLRERIDALSEIVVTFCKIQGSVLADVVVEFGSGITGYDKDVIYSYIVNCKLFNYYVYLTYEKIESINKKELLAVYYDYYSLMDLLAEQRKKYGLAESLQIDTRKYKTIFYNDFDINNPKIKVLVDVIKSNNLVYFGILDEMKICALLNADRDSLKDRIKAIGKLRDEDYTSIINLIYGALDEMPSGALNGFTPNEAKKIEKKITAMEFEKEINHIEQVDACLSANDADLFYKLYFGLLSFVNVKYNIKPKMKIYRAKKVNPMELYEIVDKLLGNVVVEVSDFCQKNPFNFSKEELKLVEEFQKGKRGLYIIAKYEKEYTGLMTADRVYMIKGITCNIDKIISYKMLPYPVITTVLPFKGVLIYDSLLGDVPINMGSDFKQVFDRDYKKSMKYYHM